MKNNGTGYSCKHCESKFERTTQMTSHMKICHTKTDDMIQAGNAITVNSPLLAVKHFFCHYSICGNGYEDFDKLSDHEREKHNFKCKKCEESFLAESDLNVHVKSQHEEEFPCNDCGEKFVEKDGLELQIKCVLTLLPRGGADSAPPSGNRVVLLSRLF